LLVSPVDSAHAKKKKNRRATTVLTIQQASGTNIRGDLSSSKDICVEGRAVQVTRSRGAVGQATTDGNGQWTINTAPALTAGEVVTARAEQRTVRIRKKRVQCASDTDTFTVGNAGGTTQRLNVSISNAGGSSGRVTSDPAGINCGTAPPSDCTQDYPTDEDVTLTAAPGAGSVFVSWAGCDSTSGNQCSVRMGGTRNVSANFNSTDGPPIPPEVCEPTGTVLDPVLCLVLELLGQ
jgi:hypothetical protein